MRLFGKKKSPAETLKARFERRLAAEERRYRLNLVKIWSTPVIMVLAICAWYWQLVSTYRSESLRVDDLEAQVDCLRQRIVELSREIDTVQKKR